MSQISDSATVNPLGGSSSLEISKDAEEGPRAAEKEKEDKSSCNWCCSQFTFALLSPSEWAIELVSLAEDIMSVYLLDEETFTFTELFLVFMLEPLAADLCGVLMFCTKTKWDDFVFAIVSEGVQCYIFMYFSSFSEEACYWFPAFCTIQVALIVWSKLVEICCMNALDKEESDEECMKECVQECSLCCGVNIGLTIQNVLFLGFTLYQENSPYRSIRFDTVLTFMAWLIAAKSKVDGAEMKAVVAKSADPADKEANAEAKVKLRDESPGLYIVQPIFFAIGAANLVYQWVLAWNYLLSGKIEKTFDEVWTWMTVISSCVFGCTAFCGCCMMAGGALMG